MQTWVQRLASMALLATTFSASSGHFEIICAPGFPPPSSGGVHVAEILNILENFDVAAIYRRDAGEFTHLVAEAMKVAFADRAYLPTGRLLPRTEPGAVIDDPYEVVAFYIERSAYDAAIKSLDAIADEYEGLRTLPDSYFADAPAWPPNERWSSASTERPPRTRHRRPWRGPPDPRRPRRRRGPCRCRSPG